jgi:hypothetical protein
MAFAVIAFAAGLTAAQRERAAAGAPPWTACEAPYDDLLERGGWQVDAAWDVTEGFADVTTRELAAFEARADRLLALLGEDELAARLALRRARVAGIGEGLIRRAIYLARAV